MRVFPYTTILGRRIASNKNALHELKRVLNKKYEYSLPYGNPSEQHKSVLDSKLKSVLYETFLFEKNSSIRV